MYNIIFQILFIVSLPVESWCCADYACDVTS